MTTTPRLGMTELAPAQALPDTTVNEDIRTLEQGASYWIVKDKDLTAPPGSPVDGDAYIVAASATGAWSGKDGKLAFRLNTGWVYVTPIEGTAAYVQDENLRYLYGGSSWAVDTSGGYTDEQARDAIGTALVAGTGVTITVNDGADTITISATGSTSVEALSWKQAVRAASTANVTLASAVENGDTIDGVTLATGDRVLLKNQTAGAENGIYTVNASGAPTRSTDADAGAELVNAAVIVSEGTANADTAWICTTNAPVTLGTTSLTWAAFGATGGGASTTQTGEGIAGFIASPADKSYKIAVKMPHGGTITETTTISVSGTCTATFKINTTALGGTANSVSSSEQSQAHSSANVFSAGDDVVLTVSSNSSCADMSFMIKYTRVLE